MRIGELARQAHCTPETIRFYEKEGLLPEPARNAANYRKYRHEHLERLRFIRNCRSLDMTHDEIRSLLHYMEAPPNNCAPVNSLLDEHIEHVDTRLKELKRLRDQLKGLRQQCARVKAVTDCGIIQGLTAMETSAKQRSDSHVA